jgi:hypothetical protein
MTKPPTTGDEAPKTPEAQGPLPPLVVDVRAAGAVALTINNFGGTAAHNFYHARNYELVVSNTASGVNTLVVENMSPTGYAALVARAPDLDYPSTRHNANGSYEHFATGYGAGLTLNGWRGLAYVEASRFDNGSSGAVPPPQYAIQQTGGAFAGAFYQKVAGLDATLFTITLHGGGRWPDDVDGMAIQEQGDAGFFNKGTTVVSGQGTETLTLSERPLLSNGYVWVLMGVPTYGQYNAMVFRERTGIHFYKWSTGASSALSPYAHFDRLNGRVAFGRLTNTSIPVSTLDVIGGGTFGNDTLHRTEALSIYPLNIVDDDSRGLQWCKVGVNSFRLDWNAGPSRIDFHDVGGVATPLSL